MSMKNFIYTSLSITGFVFHVFYISKAYFQFATVVDLSLQWPPKIILPGITVCYDPFYSFSTGKINQSFSNSNFYPYDQDFGQRAARMPIKDLFQIADAASDLKIDCTLLCSQNEILNLTNPFSCADVNCSLISPVTPTISMSEDYRFSKCFTHFFRFSNQSLIQDQNLVADKIKFKIRSSNPHLIFLLIHSPRIIPNVALFDKMVFNMSDVLRAQAGFEVSIVQSYYCQKFSQGSQIACFYECERRIMLQDCGSWPYHVPASSSVEIPFFNGSKECEPRPESIFRWINSCPECGGKDCFSLHFMNELKALHLATEKRREFFEMEINVRRQYRFFRMYISRPKIILAEYLVYLGSCAGIWFGASVTDIIKATMVDLKSIQMRFVRLKRSIIGKNTVKRHFNGSNSLKSDYFSSYVHRSKVIFHKKPPSYLFA